MTQTFTPNDIVRYLYQELPDKDQQSVRSVLSTEEELAILHREMLAAKELLEQVSMEPSDKTVNQIIAFSHNYQVCKVR